LVSPSATGEGIQAVADITGALVLRRTGQVVLVVERTTMVMGVQPVFCYIHEGDESGVLEEGVTQDGFHRFCVYTIGHLGGRLAQFFDPGGRTVADGPGSVVCVEALGSDPRVQDAESVTIISVLRPNAPAVVNTVVYSGPAGVFALQGEDPNDETKTLTPLGPDALTRLATRLLANSGVYE
jgi:hypothetical protein